jgi:hypothetical protein
MFHKRSSVINSIYSGQQIFPLIAKYNHQHQSACMAGSGYSSYLTQSVAYSKNHATRKYFLGKPKYGALTLAKTYMIEHSNNTL